MLFKAEFDMSGILRHLVVIDEKGNLLTINDPVGYEIFHTLQEEN